MPTSRVSDLHARLIKGGSTGGHDKAKSGAWPYLAGDYLTTYGGPSDLWDRNWTPADINSDNFGFSIQAKIAPHLFVEGIAQVDYVEISVFYRPGPIADAGPDVGLFMAGDSVSVTLDGSGSTHPVNAPLTYRWEGGFVGGLAFGVRPTVVFTSLGNHVVTLVVSDGTDTATDQVTVTILTGAQARTPGTAAGAPPWFNPGAVLGLDQDPALATFFSSSPESPPLTVQRFGFDVPVNAIVTGIRVDAWLGQAKSDLSASTRIFTRSGNLLRQGLMLDDSCPQEATCSRTTTAPWPGLSTGFQSVSYGGPGELWGRSWTPADINRDDFGFGLSAAASPLAGDVTLAMVDHIRIVVFFSVLNERPIANAGEPQTMTLTGTSVSVTLDGSGSSDPDGDELTYVWKGDFKGGNFQESVAMGVTPTVQFTTLGEHVVTLVVGDGALTASHTTTVTVLDGSPPAITFMVSPAVPDGDNGWYRSNVTVTWTVTEPQSPGSLALIGCTNQSITADQPMTAYSCTATSDGGSSGPVTVTIGRDATPPTVTAIASPVPNANGWNNSDVTLIWDCSDLHSGVASVSGSDVISTQGAGQSRSGSCTDRAGNTAGVTVGNINIDKIPPKVTGSRSPDPNTFGWNNTDVTVTWACGEALSGVASLTPDQVVSSEGIGQSRTGTCTDLAGNTGSGTVDGINIDKRTPDLVGGRSPDPNAFGWNNGDVTVFWSCRDPAGPSDPANPFAMTNSGVAEVTGEQVVSTEGAGQSRTGICTDHAGNTGTAIVGDISIDKTPPVITGAGSPAPNAHGWNNTDVSISWTCTDVLSGAAGIGLPQPVSSEGAGQSRSSTCGDRAGNIASVTVGDINIDKTPPAVTGTPSRAPDHDGWYRNALTVAWSGHDGLSGVDGCSAASPYAGPDDPGVSVSGSCTDRAGNTGAGEVSFRYDATPPVITFTGNQGRYGATQTVTIACTPTDPISGIDAARTACPELDQPAYSFEPGSHSLAATATDQAGNVQTAQVTFTIEVTPENLQELVNQFVRDDAGANGLGAKLRAIGKNGANGGKQGQIKAFINQVEAKRGKTLTNEQADALIRMAGGL